MSKSVRSELSVPEPAYTCSCGKTYLFYMPPNCDSCGSPIDKQNGWVEFDPNEYSKFKQRVDKVGLKQATKELES